MGIHSGAYRSHEIIEFLSVVRQRQLDVGYVRRLQVLLHRPALVPKQLVSLVSGSG